MRRVGAGAYNDRCFKEPVQIAIGIAGDIRYVMNVRQAVDALQTNWPVEGSATYRNALLMCQKALHGNNDPDLARAAFVEAAREARILVE